MKTAKVRIIESLNGASHLIYSVSHTPRPSFEKTEYSLFFFKFYLDLDEPIHYIPFHFSERIVGRKNDHSYSGLLTIVSHLIRRKFVWILNARRFLKYCTIPCSKKRPPRFPNDSMIYVSRCIIEPHIHIFHDARLEFNPNNCLNFNGVIH